MELLAVLLAAFSLTTHTILYANTTNTHDRALSFFNIMSKLPGDMTSIIIDHVQKPDRVGQLTADQIIDIWSALPEDTHAGGSQGPEHQLAGLHDALAPLYRTESLRLHEELDAQLARNGFELLRTYCKPMSDEELHDVVHKKIPATQWYAWNIPGTREYMRKLRWVRMMEFAHQVPRNKANAQIVKQQVEQELQDVVAWDVAVRAGDTSARKKIVASWIAEQVHEPTIYLHLASPEELHLLAEVDPRYLTAVQWVFNMHHMGESALYHTELAALAPHIRSLKLYDAEPESAARFLRRYSWDSLKTLDLARLVDAQDQGNLQAWRTQYPAVHIPNIPVAVDGSGGPAISHA